MPQDVALLERANQGELPCPCCETPLRADVVPRIEPEAYQMDGILLSCLCGFQER